MKIELIGHLLI